MAKAGLQSIYLSGWQVAADSNMAGQTYPDQSLYPANSAAKLVERINNAFIRADQIAHMEGSDKHIDFFLPIVADCEAGFGGPLNAFELTKAMVRIFLYNTSFKLIGVNVTVFKCDRESSLSLMRKTYKQELVHLGLVWFARFFSRLMEHFLCAVASELK